ncbi:hypothetical protein VHEMI08589 [[Torrubiella] hemipterigena]|uniref:Mid2 domain-containing protein n=1 Tax=[Torrubiella] hemipterigena TaxID=1531966 RepID=A0A0A1TPZ1_9HYPO|nr:hypothetical protein VHEMI08589 [[Torrubiella] hemipterigena]
MRFHVSFSLAALLATASANVINPRQIISTPSGSSTSDDKDVTVTRTTTVTPAGSTVTKLTTATTTSVSVLLITKTDVSTTTVTQAGGTATKIETHWVTVTSNVKRSLPEPTLAPAALHALFRRATFTSVKTVTADGSDPVTTTETTTTTKKTFTSSETTITSTETSTENPGASATVTSVTTKTTTVYNIPTDSPSDNNGSDNNGSDSGGLTTGAKAGIGAGVGVAGLAIIAGLLWLCLRRKKEPKEDPYDMTGSSMVPVGGAGAGAGATHAANNTYLAPARNPIKTQPSPEGYRGTAMGDGRAGYAKPDGYGQVYGSAASRTPSAHTAATHPPTRGGADSLPEHAHPADMDSPAASGSYAPVSALSSANPSPAPPFVGHNLPPTSAPHSGVPAAIIPGAGAGAAMGAAGAISAATAPTARMAELSNDNAPANRWHTDNAAEIDSQPVMSHQSGPVYEMGS